TRNVRMLQLAHFGNQARKRLNEVRFIAERLSNHSKAHITVAHLIARRKVIENRRRRQLFQHFISKPDQLTDHRCHFLLRLPPKGSTKKPAIQTRCWTPRSVHSKDLRCPSTPTAASPHIRKTEPPK